MVTFNSIEHNYINKIRSYRINYYDIAIHVFIMPQEKNTSLSTIERAFKIIELIVELEGAGVTEVADHIDVPKSTAHSYLTTLHEVGYLVKEDQEYDAALQFLTIGGSAAVRLPSYYLLSDKVNQLADITGERVQFITEEHGHGVYICESKGENAVQTDVRIGKRVNLHTTAAGKAILAHLDEAELDHIITNHHLNKETERTITDEAKLRECLASIRDRGYAFNNGERIQGQRAVGAAIVDDETVLGAISISGPMHRVRRDLIEEEISNELLAAVNELNLNMRF